MLGAPFTGLAQEKPRNMPRGTRATPLSNRHARRSQQRTPRRRGDSQPEWVSGRERTRRTTIQGAAATSATRSSGERVTLPIWVRFRRRGSVADAINSQGTVVGTSGNGLIDPVTGFPESVATIWTHGEIKDLGTLGGPFSIPIAINDRGQVAGGATNTVADPDGFALLLLGVGAIPGNQWHATLWQNGSIQDLGTLADGLTSFAAL